MYVALQNVITSLKKKKNHFSYETLRESQLSNQQALMYAPWAALIGLITLLSQQSQHIKTNFVEEYYFQAVMQGNFKPWDHNFLNVIAN